MPNHALCGCNLIDGRKSGVQENMTILERDGKIERIGKTGALEIPEGYASVDLHGRYVMPGLINAHVHLLLSGKPMKAGVGGKSQDRAIKLLDTGLGHRLVHAMVKRNAVTMLHSGLTTARALGDMFYSDVKLRDLIAEGKAEGPRLLVSGPIICVTGGHGGSLGNVADSPWEARKRVRENIHHQVDLIKICSTGGVSDARKVGEAGRLQMTLEEISAVCEEAHKAGFMVASHTQSTEGIRLALQGGVDTIEHGSSLDAQIIDLFLHNPKSLRGYSCLVPTLAPAIAIGRIDPALTKMKPVNIANSNIVYENMVKGMNQALAAGVKVGMGTDASLAYVTHYGAWRELYYMVKYAGFRPETAIQCATRVNAEILGIEDQTGTIEEGKSADLIVLDGNPLEDLRTLSAVRMVMAGARFIEKPRVRKRPKLDAVLDSLDGKE